MTPVDAMEQMNGLLMEALKIENIKSIIGEENSFVVYYQGDGSIATVSEQFHAVVSHEQIRSDIYRIGGRNVEYTKLMIVELKAPISIEDSFFKLQTLVDYLEFKIAVNVTDMGAIKRWLPTIINSGSENGYHTIVFSQKYTFQDDLQTRLY